MTDINLGITGAARTSWSRHNPRDLLLRIRRRHPTADLDESFAIFLEEIEKPRNRRYIPAILEYWHSNTYRALTREERDAVRQDTPTEDDERAAQRAAADAAATAEISGVVERLLLDYLMPNDKKLRECSFGYCRQIGGWLSRVGNAGEADQIVGDVLDEAAVRQLLMGS